MASYFEFGMQKPIKQDLCQFLNFAIHMFLLMQGAI